MQKRNLIFLGSVYVILISISISFCGQEEELLEDDWKQVELKFNNFIDMENRYESRNQQAFQKLKANFIEAKKRITFNSTILSTKVLEDKQKVYKMNISYQGELKKNPAIMLIIMQNDTDILITKRVNKYYYWETGQTIGACVIFCMIVVGNLSILHRLKSCRRRRSNVNYFIVQLAIADLFVGIFNVPLDTLLRLQREFTYGPFACLGTKYISVLFTYASTFMLVALSIDRWEAVVKPLAFTRNRSGGYYLVVGAWSLAFICALPVTLKTDIKIIEKIPQCWVDLSAWGWKCYMIYLTCTLLVVPTIIIAICYTHIVHTIWSKGKLVMQQESQQELYLSSNQRKINGSINSSSSSLDDQELHNNNNNNNNSKIIHKNQVTHEPNAPVNGRHKHRNTRMKVLDTNDGCAKEDADDDYVSTDEDEVNLDRLASAKNKNSTHSKQTNPQANNSESDGLERASRKLHVEVLKKKGNYLAQQHGSGVIPKARIKTIKMTLVIVAAFILCWSPFGIINFCSVFDLMPQNSPLSIALATLSQSLAHLNSAVNPIIFWLFSSKRNNSNSRARSRPQASNDSRFTQRIKENIPLWDAILCCRYLPCCLTSSSLITNSRVFEATGTSATGVVSLERNTSLDVKPETYKPLHDHLQDQQEKRITQTALN